MSDTIKDVSVRLLFPIYFMMVAGTYIPRTIVSLISSGQFGTLCSPSAFKDAWFARFWGVYGPLIRQNNSTVVAPLIDQARGIVLDIGPGSGEWLSLFNKENVTKIYGVEPNVDHHPRLREKIVQAGLQDKYVIIPVGIEDLGEGWVQKGSVDSVVTVLCLCSIPTPEYVISELYQYMREGGIWIIYEHVKTKEGALMTTYQSLLNLAWPHFLGGCSITRDTVKSLKSAGPWSQVNIPPLVGPKYQVIPHAGGVLVK